MQQKPAVSAYPGNEVAATLKPGLLKTGVFFLDETGVLRTSREPVFIVGHIHSREPSALTRRIQTIRDRYKWYDEMKWNLITGGNRNLEAYGKVLDAFFDCTLDEARFGCIVMLKRELDIKKYFLGNVWEAYEAFAALEVRLSLYDDEIVTVLADDMSVPAGVTFEQNLKRRVNDKKGRMAITNVVRLGSKGCALIQLADLLVGAVAYDFKLRLNALPAPPSKDKLKMLERIKGAIGATDFTKGFKSTTTRGRKMRVRLFNARLEAKEAKKDIAGHDPSGVTPATAKTLVASDSEVNVAPDELKGLTGSNST